MRLKCRNIVLVAKSEYVKWLRNPRMIMVFAAFIPIRETIIVPMIRAAEEMGQPLNIFETCIAAANSGLLLLLMPLVYLVLMAAFPTVDENMLFYIQRMGRKNWILGEILFQVMSAFTYCAILIGAIILQTAGISFFANGWSIPATDYDKTYFEVSGFHMRTVLPPNLCYQISPYKAFFLSYILLTLFLLLCSMIFLLGCLYFRKLLFFFLLIAQAVVGYGLCEIEKGVMWLFPFGHSVLVMHYQEYFREYVFPPWLSVVLFLSVLFILAVMSYQKAKIVNLDMIGGNLEL